MLGAACPPRDSRVSSRGGLREKDRKRVGGGHDIFLSMDMCFFGRRGPSEEESSARFGFV